MKYFALAFLLFFSLDSMSQKIRMPSVYGNISASMFPAFGAGGIFIQKENYTPYGGGMKDPGRTSHLAKYIWYAFYLGFDFIPETEWIKSAHAGFWVGHHRFGVFNFPIAGIKGQFFTHSTGTALAICPELGYYFRIKKKCSGKFSGIGYFMIKNEFHSFEKFMPGISLTFYYTFKEQPQLLF